METNSILTIGYSKEFHHIKVSELPMSVGGCFFEWFCSVFKYQGEFNPISLNNGGLLIFPGIFGHLYPIWGDKPNSSIIGIKDGTTVENYISALIECIGFEICDNLESLKLHSLRVDGGLSNIKSLIQLIADCLRIEIIIDEVSSESTSYGGALISSGLSYDSSNLSIINPNLENSKLRENFKSWKMFKRKLFDLLKEFDT
jgi:glycerol kinase